MQKENQHYNIQPADRLASVSEYYFSRKLKEVAKMNAEGKDVISLGIGSPDMPPSEETINVLCENARKADAHGYQPTVGIPELRKVRDWYRGKLLFMKYYPQAWRFLKNNLNSNRHGYTFDNVPISFRENFSLV